MKRKFYRFKNMAKLASLAWKKHRVWTRIHVAHKSRNSAHIHMITRNVVAICDCTCSSGLCKIQPKDSPRFLSYHTHHCHKESDPTCAWHSADFVKVNYRHRENDTDWKSTVAVSSAAVWLKQHTFFFFFTIMVAGKSSFKVPEDLIFGKGSLPGLQTLLFAVFSGAERGRLVSIPLLIRALILSRSLVASSKPNHLQRHCLLIIPHSSLGLQHKDLGEDINI